VKRHRHTLEQAVRKVGEGERLLNDGTDLAEVLRTVEVSEATWNRWRAQDGGRKAGAAKRPKELAAGNARLQRLVADRRWTSACSRSWPREPLTPGSGAAGPRWPCGEPLRVPERRACRVAGQPRATRRRPRPVRPDRKARLRSRLRGLAGAQPRWAGGWCGGCCAGQPAGRGSGATTSACGGLWREEARADRSGPQPPPGRGRHRPAVACRAAQPRLGGRLRVRPDRRWRRLKLATVVDEHAVRRWRCGWVAGARCWPRQRPGRPGRRPGRPGAPAGCRRPGADRLGVAGWCRLSGAQACTSSRARRGRTLRRALQRPGPRPAAQPRGGRQPPVAQVVVGAWRIEYDTDRPHSALDGLTRPGPRRPGPAPPNPHPRRESTTNQGPVSYRAVLAAGRAAR
jgi:hypothetical protein